METFDIEESKIFDNKKEKKFCLKPSNDDKNLDIFSFSIGKKI